MRAFLSWQKQLVANDAARSSAEAFSRGHVRRVPIAQPLDLSRLEQNATTVCRTSKKLPLNLLLLPHEAELKLVRDDPALREEAERSAVDLAARRFDTVAPRSGIARGTERREFTLIHCRFQVPFNAHAAVHVRTRC